MGRTWMKLTDQWSTLWLGIEGDSIVAVGGDASPMLIGKRADDTISILGKDGFEVEGPYDRPE